MTDTETFPPVNAGSGYIEEFTELMAKLEGDNDDARQEAIERLDEMPLSIMVRDGWRDPFGQAQDGPEEFEILLGTGGPATRIWGTFGQYGVDHAELQYQDWFKPWTEIQRENSKLIHSVASFYVGGMS